MSFTWLDYSIIAVIALSVLTGLFRGFVKELVALCVWIAAIWLALNYANALDPWLLPYLQDKTVRVVAAFILILLATILAGAICNALLSFILHRSGLSGTDRLLGMGFGFVRGVFIVALLMLVVNMTSLVEKQSIQESRLYVKFDPLVVWLSGFTPEFIKQVHVFDKHDEVKDAINMKPILH